MSCERFAESLGDLVDGTIDDASREALDAHLATCADCRSLADDFRQIRRSASRLDRMTPPERVWTRIAAAIVRDAPAERPAAGRAPLMAWSWVAAAAGVILVVGTTVWMLPEVIGPDGPGTGQVAQGDAETVEDETALIESVATELRLAEEHYERAITGLERIAMLEDESLDPQVAATLEKNLEIIDQAIAESRAALRVEPANQMAQESLFEVMWRKVSLLQDTIALVNEMRKGNQTEAARIVDGLKRP